jgi:hypothetical protein
MRELTIASDVELFYLKAIADGQVKVLDGFTLVFASNPLTIGINPAFSSRFKM